MNTQKGPTGMDIINGMRQHLEKFIAESMNKEDTDIDTTFDVLTGWLAVADALDIITDREYNDATSDVYHYLTGLRTDPITFPLLSEHYLKDAGMQEALLTLRINLQERLNENFRKYREHSALVEYTKSDVIAANMLFIAFATEFRIIEDKDIDKANKVVEEYVHDNVKTEKVIFVPEAFYTKR